jgi:hypothetical protein
MVLEDHRREGKKFIPPMKHMMNFTEVHYVERILPEIAWIAFLIEDLGAQQGIHVASTLIRSPWPHPFTKNCGLVLECFQGAGPNRLHRSVSSDVVPLVIRSKQIRGHREEAGFHQSRSIADSLISHIRNSPMAAATPPG